MMVGVNPRNYVVDISLHILFIIGLVRNVVR